MRKHESWQGGANAVERTLNVLAIVAALVFVSAVARALVGTDSGHSSSRLEPGMEVVIPGVDWEAYRQTLIMVLQTDCEPCDESVPFYRDLLTSNTDNTFRLIVVVPYAANAGMRQLERYGLEIGDVRQADLGSLRVPGTPTLMLVGSDGRLKRAWVGKLPSTAEDSVFRALGLRRLARTSRRVSGQGYEEIDAHTFASERRKLSVLDTRPREEFLQSHIRGAVNIPLDELAVRLRHEWLADTETILYCHRVPACDIYVVETSGTVRTECDLTTDSARLSGIKRLRILTALDEELESVGIEIVRARSDP